MAKSTMDAAIRERVDAFVADLEGMIRQAALEAVHEVLAGEKPAAAPRGRKKAKRRAGRPAKAGARRPAKAGKRIRRSGAEVQELAASVRAYVRKNPGQRLGEIAKAVGAATKDVRRPAFSLVEAGELKTTGQRGGTRYFAKGAAPRKTSAAKTGRKRPAAKKKAKRKAAKRRTTKARTTKSKPAA